MCLSTRRGSIWRNAKIRRNKNWDEGKAHLCLCVCVSMSLCCVWNVCLAKNKSRKKLNKKKKKNFKIWNKKRKWIGPGQFEGKKQNKTKTPPLIMKSPPMFYRVIGDLFLSILLLTHFWRKRRERAAAARHFFLFFFCKFLNYLWYFFFLHSKNKKIHFSFSFIIFFSHGSWKLKMF